jgi:hypothetical protein
MLTAPAGDSMARFLVLQRGSATAIAEADGSGLLDIARGLATDPKWSGIPGATLVIRPAPRPLVGVLGRIDASDACRLAWLRRQLAEDRPRCISYEDVEEDCEHLASILVDRFGLGELRGFAFTALPRGGLIVLGMLAYRLDLRHAQIEPSPPASTPLVLVDDSAMTGFRFGRWLQQSTSDQVVFAPLYAPAALCAEIEAREPRVVACISARELRDDAPERLGVAYPAWRAERLRKLVAPRYWIGQPEHICFPWSQPDYTFQNPATGEREREWSLVPPDRCLRNRAGVAIPSIPVQLQRPGRGALQPAPNILVADVEEGVVILDVDAERSLKLEGVAADMWRALLAHRNPAEVVSSLATIYDADTATLETDLSRFVRSLVTRGVLEHADEFSSVVT